jgi:hypothetical protein
VLKLPCRYFMLQQAVTRVHGSDRNKPENKSIKGLSLGVICGHHKRQSTKVNDEVGGQELPFFALQDRYNSPN